jgi:phospholipase C
LVGKPLLVFALLALTICAGCSSAAGSSGTPPAPLPTAPSSPGENPGNHVKHVVVIIQENRSFDDFFATFPGADGATEGRMKTQGGGDIFVHLVKGSLDSDDFGHDHGSFEKEYDHGKMDGFGEVQRTLSKGVKIPAGKYAYRYVNPNEIAPYWSIAQQYVLADHMFTTQSSSSFTAHQDLIAGGTPIGDKGNNVVDFPTPPYWGCDAPQGTVTSLITSTGRYLFDEGPFPCFGYATLRDLLDAKSVSWRYFTNTSDASVWDAFDAIHAVREGPEWTTHVVRPGAKIFQAIDTGELPAVSWVIPNAENSDHPGFVFGDTGPSWVTSVVNAIGKSSYWDSTVIVVLWDEWGGEYDNVPPPQLDGQGLGMRVPMLVISAYTRRAAPDRPGYISHTQYEDGSILKFIEDNWKLGRLGTSDQRANSIVNCFDFNQSPHEFKVIQAKYSRSFFEQQPPSKLPVDTD